MSCKNMKTSQKLPYRIGLTGNIATGKSTVGQMLVDLGAEHIDADHLSHIVLAPDGTAYAPVVAAFGEAILTPDGSINRRALGDIVFADPEALAQLERLVHPPVLAEINRRISISKCGVVVIEAIKLLETRSAIQYDTIWVTTCSIAAQIKRLMTTRNLSREDAQQRIHAQGPQAEKLAQADVIINTEGTLEQTRQQIEKARGKKSGSANERIYKLRFLPPASCIL